ncbi:MAG: hypothetical protein ACYS8Z_13440 [Planctomycetota bacterium]|jgi:hypothetical protein
MRKATLEILMTVFSLAIICSWVDSALADFTISEPRNLGPSINTSASEGTPCVSKDGLALYFTSNRFGGSGMHDLWVTRRNSIDDAWSAPTNLGSNVNSGSMDYFPSISDNELEIYFYSARSGGGDIWKSTRPSLTSPWTNAVKLANPISTSSDEVSPHISADGLSLYFASNRPGGRGDYDIYVCTRGEVGQPWSAPVGLDSSINTSALEVAPTMTSDGLALFFHSTRSGGHGSYDLYVSFRQTVNDAWSEAVNVGSPVNTSYSELGPSITGNGRLLYFSDHYFQPPRPGGYGVDDLWEVSFEPVVDFNGDKKIDFKDFCALGQSWGKDNPLVDIGPTPFGDSVINIQDVIALAGSWLWRATEEAWGPSPEDGATGVVAVTQVTLSWKLGEALDTEGCTVGYILYFGADKDSLTEYDTVGQTSCDVGGRFTPSTTYYWRIDTKRQFNRPPFGTVITAGNVWSFTTE